MGSSRSPATLFRARLSLHASGPRDIPSSMPISPRAISALAAPLLIVALRAGQQPAAEQFWPQWRGPQATGASATATPPLEWSETKNIKWKVEIPGRAIRHPRRLGRPAVRADRRAGERHGRYGACRAGRPARAAQVRRDGDRSAYRQDPLGARGARAGAARGHASRERNLGIELRGHRRRARDCVVRVGGALRVRHEREARSGRRISATSGCATSSARAARPRCTATGWWSSGITRESRSSSRSTSAPATSCGGRSATRSTHGRPR